MGSQEGRVDVELTEDMVIVGYYLKNDEWKLTALVCSCLICRGLRDSARHQSSRTAYIACA